MGLKGRAKSAGKVEKVFDPWDRQRSDQRWIVPETIQVVEGREGPALDWTWPEIPEEPPFDWPEITVQGDGELLDQLIKVAETEQTPPDQRGVAFEECSPVNFVRRYGVPGLCERHGLPLRSWHVDPRCRRGGECEVWRPLPVEEVLRIARAVRGMIVLSVNLENEETATREQWERFLRAHLPRAEHEKVSEWASDHAQAGTEEQYRRLTLYLDEWAQDGGIRLRVRRREGAFRVEPWHRNTLLGAISRQLFLTVVGDAGIAVCHGCGAIFTPSRKPAKGRRSWCQKCGKGSDYKAAKRLSARDQE